MCGIAGIIHPSQSSALAGVRSMNEAQAHRGPDGDGTWHLRIGDVSLALGHRRLAIQDLSPAGRQPMGNPSTGDVVVYNGELYNVVQLRSQLAAAGALFRGHSDTEVLLAAFERWGIACLDRLFGMFAFALWAARERRLYLVRDPLGIKPLYWAANAGALVLASELRAVLSSGLVEHRVDPIGLQSLLAYGAVAQPRTMIEGVRLLPPGTWVAVRSGFRRKRLPHSTQTVLGVRRDAPRRDLSAASGRGTPHSAVGAARSHLVSDAPLAVFLSGGIDSTAIAALAREAREIDTFTVRLAEDVEMDEAPIARNTAAALATRHHEVVVRERDALHLASKWLSSVDQPSVDGLNTYVIARAAREQGIVVALSGLGGDEMFGGYSTFYEVPRLLYAARAARRLPAAFSATIARRFASNSATRAEKLHDLLDLDASAVSISLWRRRLLSDVQMKALGFDDLGHRQFLPPECDPWYGVPSNSVWGAVRAVETQLYMSNMLLRDADVFGMAHGLEIRVPLLDRRVVDAALAYARPSLDPRRTPNKPWLVEALAGRVPPEVLNRTKTGFVLPQARWMSGPLREAFEERIEATATSGLVDGRGVREFWERFFREPRGPAWSRAWMLGALGEWISRTRSDTAARSRTLAAATAT